MRNRLLPLPLYKREEERNPFTGHLRGGRWAGERYSEIGYAVELLGDERVLDGHVARVVVKSRSGEQDDKRADDRGDGVHPEEESVEHHGDETPIFIFLQWLLYNNNNNNRTETKNNPSTEREIHTHTQEMRSTRLDKIDAIIY